MRNHLNMTHLHEDPEQEKKVWVQAYCASLAGARASVEFCEQDFDAVSNDCIGDANEALEAFKEKFYGGKLADVPDDHRGELGRAGSSPDSSTGTSSGDGESK